MEMTVVPLHKHPEYTMECCQLINEEWKRSIAARIHSLKSSCDRLPTSLVLLGNKKVIGYLKLSPIPSIKDACFVESVVIDRELRGKGFGTVLMKRAEEYCRDFLNLDTIYLSTKGQQTFYKKLGYAKCSPISMYGSYTPITTAPQQNFKTVNKNCGPPPPPMPVNKTPAVISSTKVFMKKQIRPKL